MGTINALGAPPVEQREKGERLPARRNLKISAHTQCATNWCLLRTASAVGTPPVVRQIRLTRVANRNTNRSRGHDYNTKASRIFYRQAATFALGSPAFLESPTPLCVKVTNRRSGFLWPAIRLAFG